MHKIVSLFFTLIICEGQFVYSQGVVHSALADNSIVKRIDNLLSGITEFEKNIAERDREIARLAEKAKTSQVGSQENRDCLAQIEEMTRTNQQSAAVITSNWSAVSMLEAEWRKEVRKGWIESTKKSVAFFPPPPPFEERVTKLRKITSQREKMAGSLRNFDPSLPLPIIQKGVDRN